MNTFVHNCFLFPRHNKCLLFIFYVMQSVLLYSLITISHRRKVFTPARFHHLSENRKTAFKVLQHGILAHVASALIRNFLGN